MSSVFISYKREDEERVARLVRALERAGIQVWWDREVPGAANWRETIETALDAAECVIVAWSEASVGPQGEFVRDEARRARGREILVPILLDDVDPPLGFGEAQAIDLTRWRGSPRDPDFRDLVATVQATVDRTPLPAPTGPRKRLMRKVTVSGLTGIVGASLAFGLNLFSFQSQICAAPLLQPRLADACGAFGFGDQPTKAERLAWVGTREAGSCDALREHVRLFPDGVFRDDAADLLQARRIERREEWVPAEHALPLYVPQPFEALETEAEARSDALGRGQTQAAQMCNNFAASTLFRLQGARLEELGWDCSASGGGFACAVSAQAVCSLEERRTLEVEVCEP